MESSGENRRVYPLSVLFLVTAGCAIFSALLTPLLRALAGGTVGFFDASVTSMGGGLFGGFLGGMVGIYHYRRGRGLIWGLLVGLSMGALLGPLSLIPVEAAPSLLGLSAAGAVLLVALAAGFRLAARAQKT